MEFGNGDASSSNEPRLRVTRNMIVKSLTMKANVMGLSTTLIFTLRKNSVNTALTLTTTNANPNFSRVSGDVSVSFVAGDFLSMQVNKNGVGSASDIVVSVETY